MDVKLTYFSDVKDGKLQTNVRQRIANELQCFEGRRVEITIQRLRSKRSAEQNRYYWALVTILANEFGYEKEEMSSVIKYKFLKREKVDEKTGEVMQYLESTTKLNKSEFADFTTSLIQWAATLNIVLPLPNTQLEIE